MTKEKSHKKRFAINNLIFVFMALLPITTVALSHWVFSLARETRSQEPVIVQMEEKSEFIDPVIFGHSVQNKEIQGYVVGDGSKTILLFGCMHGNEMGSNDLLERLVLEIKNKPDLLSDQIKLVIIPILNPDGYYDRVDKLNGNSVNLNLNFNTTEWLHYGPDRGDWAGLQPFSEPESQLLKKVVEEYSPEMMISYHSSGAVSVPEGNESSKRLAKWYAEKSGYTYDDSMDYAGTATRWFAEEYGKTAITIELTDYYLSDWEINKQSLLELTQNNYPL